MNNSLAYICKISTNYHPLGVIRNICWMNSEIINTKDFVNRNRYLTEHNKIILCDTSISFNHCIFNIKEDFQSEEDAIKYLIISLVDQKQKIDTKFILGDIIKNRLPDGRVIYALPSTIIVE